MKAPLTIALGLALLSLQAQVTQLSFYETYSWPSSVHESIVWGADDNGMARFLRFDSPDLQVLTGTSELLMAQWFAKARNEGYDGFLREEIIVNKDDGSADTVRTEKALTAVNATGISIVKQTYYDARMHRLVSRISSFGPGMSGVIWLPVQENPDLKISQEEAIKGPSAYIWSARISSTPPEWSIKSVLDQYPEDIMLQEVQDGHLKLEMKSGDSWVEANPPEGELKWISVTEDLYYDSGAFSMFSRVIEAGFSAKEGEYRIRFAE